MSGQTDCADPHTLLIVDDEVNILASLQRLFRPDGYRLLRAHNGRDALEILARHPVGVMISAHRMPDMNWIQFHRLARDSRPECVRIVLSCYSENHAVMDEMARQVTVYQIHTKPWDNEALRETVRAAFQTLRVTRG
jgi:DNA-binding NtrC family response regulator